MKRLNIIVPYRARKAHLDQFVPHLRTYFARDKSDREIPYRVLIIEQEDGLPFNRGALKNIGFKLARDASDYVCFHDVDYLPVWADYRYSEGPCGIVWYGAESRLVAPGRSNAVVAHKSLDVFLGGALLCPNDVFASVNGYSNQYWGWGWEDSDLISRFTAAGIAVYRRKGTFLPLPHEHEGYDINLALKPIAIVNEKIFNEKWANKTAPAGDGLSDLAFDILKRGIIPEGPESERAAIWEMITVRLNMQPRQDQVTALQRG